MLSMRLIYKIDSSFIIYLCNVILTLWNYYLTSYYSYYVGIWAETDAGAFKTLSKYQANQTHKPLEMSGKLQHHTRIATVGLSFKLKYC